MLKRPERIVGLEIHEVPELVDVRDVLSQSAEIRCVVAQRGDEPAPGVAELRGQVRENPIPRGVANACGLETGFVAVPVHRAGVG